MQRYLRYVFMVLEATSPPLLFLTLLLVVSGYAIMYPHAYSTLTLGALNYAVAQRIHIDPLIRLSFTALAFIHGLAGTIVLVEKYVKHRLVKEAAESIALITAILLLTTIIAIDLSNTLR